MRTHVRFGRLRGRLGLWLLRPFILNRLRLASGAAEAGIQPASYHADWWWGQYFAVRNLESDCRVGRPVSTDLALLRAASARARGEES